MLVYYLWLVQLVWKSSKFRNFVGSNWNKPKKKPPSRQCRDVLRLLKFNAPQQEYSSTSHIAEKSSDTVSQELRTAASTSTTTRDTHWCRKFLAQPAIRHVASLVLVHWNRCHSGFVPAELVR